jgi:RecB family exonuclease
MTTRVITAGYGAAALDALGAAVAEAKQHDAMTPVTVLVPNNLAGIVARRYLAAGVGGSGGIAALDVTTLPRLAERIATPLLAPRRPATRPVVAAAWRAVLAEDPLVFRDIAAHPATVRALVAAHTELRDIGAAARAGVQGASTVAGDLVTLHERVVDRLRTDWYDSTDVLTMAAQHAPSAGHVVLYLPQDMTQAEIGFAAALAAHADLVVIAGRTGAKRADRAVLQTIERLEAESPVETRAVGTATRVLNASDSDDEVRCVVRDLMRTLRTVPAHRVAVLYSAAVPYARLLHEQLAAAGVAVNGPGVVSVDERAVARTLREVLALADGDVPRGAMFRAIAGAPTRDFAGERIPVARWERISRSAGVVAGDDWTTRLAAYIDDRRAEAESERGAVDRRDWLIARLQRDADNAAALQAFAARLRSEFAAARDMRTWRELAGWALDLFTGLVGAAATLERLPAEEQYAAASVTSLLTGLIGLDAVEPAADLAALRDVLDAELAASLPRVGRFGDGVLVAPISAAIGLDLDVAFLVGLSEDSYPGRLAADALLPERARAAAAGELPDDQARLHAKYRHLLAAYSCAGEVVAAFPRGDLRRSSRRLPSRWLLPSLRELAGDHSLAATSWDQPSTYGDALGTSGSFAGELLHTDTFATEQEWRVREAAAVGFDDDVVRAAVAMIRGRASSDLTRYDGNLAGVAGLPDYAVDERAVSPTALEGYAACPHAFFIGRLLGVNQLEQPEDIVTISALDIGNLVHESVDELITEFAGSLPGEGRPWTAAQRDRLVEIATAKAEQFRARGLTGHPRLWDRERVRVLNDVEWLLADDDRWRAEVGAAVLASELPFGLHGVDAVEVPIAGGRVRMRGSADKVDRARDGTILVTDIKTGSDRTFKDISQDEPTALGTKLQLPVYAYAARQRFGDADTPVAAAYWFVRKSRGRRISVELTPEVDDAYRRTLAILVRSIATGLFPPRAPESADFAWVQCDYCNPDGVGHADARDRWERKRSDPALREYVELVEPDALT